MGAAVVGGVGVRGWFLGRDNLAFKYIFGRVFGRIVRPNIRFQPSYSAENGHIFVEIAILPNFGFSLNCKFGRTLKFRSRCL